MKDRNFEQGMHQLREPAERTPACPDDFVLAAITEGATELEDKENLKNHLSSCKYCIEQLADLSRIKELDDGEPVPDLALARAKRLGRNTGTPHQAPRWAAAAVVVLALVIVGTRGPQTGEEPVITSPDAQQELKNPHQLRNIDRAVFAPRIISPLEGDSIETGDLKVQWTEVPGSLHYDVRVVTAEGFIVWTEQVKDTEWSPPVDHPLEPGVTYFVRVDAYLAVADSVSSEHIPFTMENRER
jgi:hypothetical protein